MNIQIPATLSRISSRADKTLSVGFHTQIIADDEKLAVMEAQGEFGYLLFSPNKFTEKDIPRDDAEYSKGKSPSERLRSVIFVRYNQLGSTDDFDVFYRGVMNNIIEQFKSKLDK